MVPATIGVQHRRSRPARPFAVAALAAAAVALLVGVAVPAAGAEPDSAKTPKTAPATPPPKSPAKSPASKPATPKPATAQPATPKAPPSDTVRIVMPRALIANGLSAKLVDGYRKAHKITVTVIPRKTGLGFAPLLDGKAELAITDDVAAERRFVADKHGIKRHNLMYTELLVVGPKTDPADVKGMISVIEAFKALAASSSTFLGRGDGSGVALAERRFWTEAGLAPDPESDSWYRVSRADMRATLVRAAKTAAYTLTDRASWLALPDTTKLMPMVADDPRLQLRYGVVVANPAGRKGLNVAAASAFAVWLAGKEAQKIIEGFKIADETPYIPESGLQR